MSLTASKIRLVGNTLTEIGELRKGNIVDANGMLKIRVEAIDRVIASEALAVDDSESYAETIESLNQEIRELALLLTVSSAYDTICDPTIGQEEDETPVVPGDFLLEKELTEGEIEISIPVTIQQYFWVLLNGYMKPSSYWSGVGSLILTLSEAGGLYDKLIVASSSEEIFEKSLAESELTFNVGFDLSSYSLVFINGWLLQSDQWSIGLSSSDLVLTTPVSQYDTVIVVKACTYIFEDVLSSGDTVVPIGTTVEDGDIVFINGRAIFSSDWSGVGTTDVTLSVPADEFDKFMLVRR